MDKIPILFLIDILFVFSGTERHLYDLVSNIDRDRFLPYVVTFRGSESFKDKIERFGAPVKILDFQKIYGRKQFEALFTLRDFIKQKNIKIIQTFHTNPDIYGTVLAKLSGIPIIISSRRDMGMGRNSRNVACYKLLNRYVDRIICVSEKVKNFVINDEGVRQDKLQVIYNGIDTAKLDVVRDLIVERRKLGLSVSAPVVGILANFNLVKGHSYFLEACAEVKKDVPDLQILIAGGGIREPEIRKHADSLGLSGAAVFTGYTEDIAGVLSAMDILVSSSLSEGFSNTILEALYMRKSVVATDVGGNAEVIFNNKTGILVPPAEHGVIAQAVLRLIKDKELSVKLGENGRKLIEEKYLLKAMMANTSALYEELISLKLCRAN